MLNQIDKLPNQGLSGIRYLEPHLIEKGSKPIAA
jgi:hypothetical protein